MGRAKSYAERLFDFPEVGALNEEDAAIAIVKPADVTRGSEFEDDALSA